MQCDHTVQKKKGILVSEKWREAYDPSTDRPYWHNTVTQENTWTKPGEM